MSPGKWKSNGIAETLAVVLKGISPAETFYDVYPSAGMPVNRVFAERLKHLKEKTRHFKEVMWKQLLSVFGRSEWKETGDLMGEKNRSFFQKLLFFIRKFLFFLEKDSLC